MNAHLWIQFIGCIFIMYSVIHLFDRVPSWVIRRKRRNLTKVNP